MRAMRRRSGAYVLGSVTKPPRRAYGEAEGGAVGGVGGKCAASLALRGAHCVPSPVSTAMRPCRQTPRNRYRTLIAQSDPSPTSLLQVSHSSWGYALHATVRHTSVID